MNLSSKNSVSSTLTKTFLASVVALSTGLSAQEQQAVYIVPSVGYIQFDDDRDIESGFLPGIGMGYSTASPWAFELHHHAMGTDDKNNNDADFEYTRLDTLYRFGDNVGWQPYLVGGVGHATTKYAEKNDSSETLFNLGGGIAYHFNDFFNVRSDIRVLQSDDGHTDGLVSAGLSLVYLFGGSKPAATHVPTPAVKPVVIKKKRVAVVAKKSPAPAVLPIDTDGDGIIDALDNCPYSSSDAKVDDKGCYVLLEEAKTFKLNVEFANNSDAINQDYLNDIAALSQFLSLYPNTAVTIEGYSDSLGQAAYNKKLSQRRAESVKQTLVEQYKIDGARVAAVGFGEENPIASNATAEGRKMNRRVNAVVSTTVKKRVTK